MDVRMPDGTIIKNVPEGTTKAQLQAKLDARSQPKPDLKASNPSEYDPSSPEFQAKYGATSGMTGMNKFMAGAGKSVVDIGRGLLQLGAEGGNKIGLVSDQTAQGLRQNQDEVNQRDADLMSTGAGISGNIAGTLATTLLPAGMLARAGTAAKLPGLTSAANAMLNPSTYRAAMGAGAVYGAIQPVGTDQSRTKNMALGAATGAASKLVTNTIGRVATPVTNALTKPQEKAVNVLKNAGVELDAAQLTGSNRLAQAKRMLGDNPFTASGQTKQIEKVAASFDRAVLKTIGETADVADEAVMSRAASRIGGVMDRVAKNNPINMDNTLITEIADIAQKAGKELEGPQAKIIIDQVDEIVSKGATGQIDGAAYQNLRQTLGRISGGGQPGVKNWAGALRESLDDALTRSASAADVADLKQARVQWRNLEGISKVIGSQEGQHISPAKLANALNTKPFGGKNAMVRGKGATDLHRLAKAGSTILTDRFPNSGTAARVGGLLATGLLGAAVGGYQEGDVKGALAYGAGGLLAPLALQQMMNRPGAANYLAKGIPALQGASVQPWLRNLPTVGLLEASQQ